MKSFAFLLFSAILFTFVTSVKVTVVEGPAHFWFLDCRETLCTEMETSKHMNAPSGESYEMILPEINELRLYVQCLNEETACSISYETLAWQSTIEVAAKEAATFVAANSIDVLKATMTPEYYNQEGDVEVTLSFFAVGSEEKPEEVELSAADLTIKNGVLNGEVTKVEFNIFRFTVTPTIKSSFAVILPRSFVSSRGIPIRQGLIHGCMFDNEAPYLLNTQYRAGLIEDQEEKTIMVALNEPTVVVSYSGVVTAVNQKEGYINTYEVVVKGTGVAEVVFKDLAGNEFTFTTSIVYDMTSPLSLLVEPELNATLPMNGRVEYAFNHFVTLPAEIKEAVLFHEDDTYTIRLDTPRYVRVIGNRVLFFFDPARMAVGSYTFSIPEGAFVGSKGQSSLAIESSFIVVGKNCNTNYVVSGMKGEKCKCYSIVDKCQCSCGETLFSRDL